MQQPEVDSYPVSTTEDKAAADNMQATEEELVDGGNPANSCTDECECSLEETPDEVEERIKQEEACRDILYKQNIIVYQQYAEEQHPKDPEKREELLTQMQEHYYEHYMAEVYRHQVSHQQEQLRQIYRLRASETEDNETMDENHPDFPEALPLLPAKMWTRKDLDEFKAQIWKTQRKCCVKIGSLATATIRVPTIDAGTCVYWEFATDNYDLGFGLFFEWTLTRSDQVTVHISETSDEEEDYDEEGGGDTQVPLSSGSSADPVATVTVGDVEHGGTSPKGGRRLPTDELIPVYRRDCHTAVYCGGHQYPGKGVYVFKFDNSFSLWRSKWLYYRIFYSR